MLLGIISAKADVVAFIAEGATNYDGTGDKVTIANSGTDGVIGSVYSKDGVCNLSWTKYNNSTSQVNGALVRWYASDVLNIECLAGTVINKIVIKASTSAYGKVELTTVVDGAESDAFAFPTGESAPYTRTWEGNATQKIQIKAGTQIRISYIEITYTAGQGVAVAAPVIEYGTEANTVAITTETEGASIYYTLDGTTPSAASALYTTPFAITTVSEVKAVAVKDGNSSAVTSTTVALNKVNDLAAFVTNANAKETLVATPVTTIYQNGRYLYIKDAKDNYLLAYNNNDLDVVKDFVNGDVLSNISGTFKLQNTLPELIITSIGEKSNGNEVDPYEVNVADITTNMANQYVTFGPVSIVAASATNNYTATDEEGNTITLYKQFNNAQYNTVVEIPEGEGFMVTGFVSLYNNNIQLIPIEFSEGVVMETVATPVFTPASGALKAGDLITIECETEGAKIYYTTEDENPSATSVTSILYDGAISFSENMNIKAIAVKEGMFDSEIATASYTLVVVGENEVTYDFTVDNGFGECSKADLEKGGDTSNGGTNSLDGVSFVQGDVTMTCSVGDGANDPKWWTDPGVRVYINNTFTFTVPEGYKLLSITANQGTASASNFNIANFAASVGSMDSAGHVWTAPENENVSTVILKKESKSTGRFGGFTVKYVSSGLSAIEEIEVDVNAPVEFFNLQGVRVNAESVAPGIYVVRQGAKTMKVLVK